MADSQTILIADPHDVTRANVASVLKSLGFNVLQAIDGASAIKVVQEHPVDLAIFEPDMSPMTGFDFARYVQGAGMLLPLVVMMAERTSDILHYANQLGIMHFLSKPVDPHRLEAVVKRILKSDKPHDPVLARYTYAASPQTPEQIMAYTLDLARRNVGAGHGGPFAAVVTNSHGHIVGEGTNMSSSRFDPVAQAEVMAIRQATENLQQSHLEGCSIFCTSEPTAIGRALITSVGIDHIYYGLSHADIEAIWNEQPGENGHKQRNDLANRPVNIIRLGHEAARDMFKEFIKK